MNTSATADASAAHRAVANRLAGRLGRAGSAGNSDDAFAELFALISAPVTPPEPQWSAKPGEQGRDDRSREEQHDEVAPGGTPPTAGEVVQTPIAQPAPPPVTDPNLSKTERPVDAAATTVNGAVVETDGEPSGDEPSGDEPSKTELPNDAGQTRVTAAESELNLAANQQPALPPTQTPSSKHSDSSDAATPASRVSTDRGATETPSDPASDAPPAGAARSDVGSVPQSPESGEISADLNNEPVGLETNGDSEAQQRRGRDRGGRPHAEPADQRPATPGERPANVRAADSPPETVSASTAQASPPSATSTSPVATITPSNAAAGSPTPSIVAPAAISAPATRADSAPARGGLPTGPAMPSATSSVDAKSKPDPATSASTLQRAKLVQRVSRGFQHLGGGEGAIRMRLSPASLGSVRLELRVTIDGLVGQISAESAAAAADLAEGLPALRQSLAAQGIQVSRIEVVHAPDLAGDASGPGSGDQSAGQPGTSDQRRRHSPNPDSTPSQPQRASDLNNERLTRTIDGWEF